MAELLIKWTKKYYHYYMKIHFTYRTKFAHEKLAKKSGGESGAGLLRASSYEYDIFNLTILEQDALTEKRILKKGLMVM